MLSFFLLPGWPVDLDHTVRVRRGEFFDDIFEEADLVGCRQVDSWSDEGALRGDLRHVEARRVGRSRGPKGSGWFMVRVWGWWGKGAGAGEDFLNAEALRSRRGDFLNRRERREGRGTNVFLALICFFLFKTIKAICLLRHFEDSTKPLSVTGAFCRGRFDCEIPALPSTIRPHREIQRLELKLQLLGLILRAKPRR